MRVIGFEDHAHLFLEIDKIIYITWLVAYYNIIHELFFFTDKATLVAYSMCFKVCICIICWSILANLNYVRRCILYLNSYLIIYCDVLTVVRLLLLRLVNRLVSSKHKPTTKKLLAIPRYLQTTNRQQFERFPIHTNFSHLLFVP